MSASSVLRRHLEDADIEYGKLGDYTTCVTYNGMSFTFRDCYDGMLTADVARLPPSGMMAIVTRGRGHAAKRYIYYGDGVGHSECAACGRLVSAGHMYCPWCGVEFEGTEMESK